MPKDKPLLSSFEDRRSKKVFMLHGAVLGFALSLMLPGLPDWVLSYEGRTVGGAAFAAVVVALTGLKAIAGRRWRIFAVVVGVVASGLALGASQPTSAASYHSAVVLVASACLFYCLSVAARLKGAKKREEHENRTHDSTCFRMNASQAGHAG